MEKSAMHERQDPFGFLGLHPRGTDGSVVRANLPWAAEAWVEPHEGMKPVRMKLNRAGVFEAQFKVRWFGYRIRTVDREGREAVFDDPYRFGPVLSESDLYLWNEGSCRRAYMFMGAHPREHEGVRGTSFAVWAPNAESVSVVGDWNGWDGRVHPMRGRGMSGVWELFIPAVGRGSHYKYEVRTAEGELLIKADPFGARHQTAPETASIVWGHPQRDWRDRDWLEKRRTLNPQRHPMAIYEVHLGSWRRKASEGMRSLSYLEHARELIPYAVDQGYTHLELLPVMEHPFEGSWGYQVTGFFAPTSRWGTPEEFQEFVEECHLAGLGVILDWVPSHFPTDAHGLGYFDGTALYEHQDPRQGFHRDWGTLIFNYGRSEVRSFLISSAVYWLDMYHADGLRVDAVASMLYLDYSRNEGEWLPNRYGGRENLEAIEFVKQLNIVVHEEVPGATTIAEESTSWPGVSRPVYAGGLGFGFKWNMGWMHDTLSYFSKNPVHRKFHQHFLTFSLLYAFSENFMLVLSHDEVVHLKGSLLAKMPGDGWRKFANLRLLLAYMTAHPGKKLLFMGGEFGQGREWDHAAELEWHLLERPQHRGVNELNKELLRLYRKLPAFWRNDFDQAGFRWVDFSDVEQSIVSFLRFGDEGDEPVLAVFNMTPVPREGYRIGVPRPGLWKEILNTDAELYGGSGVGNMGTATGENQKAHGMDYSVVLTLPPLGALFLTPG